MISLNTIILIVFPVFLVLFIVLLFIQKKKRRGFLVQGMNLALFLVTLPQQIEKEKEFSIEEYLKTAEQFYSSLKGIKERNFIKRLLFGNPFLIFEIAVHRIGEEIYFYVACPRQLSQLIEKQILGFWPKAQVQPVLDYNIFNPEGQAVGSVANLSKTPIFPLKPLQEFITDPLSAITSVFTKLAREEEGAAIQILIRPSKRSLKKLAEKTMELIQKGQRGEEAFKTAQTRTGAMGVFKEMEKVILPETKKELEQKFSQTSQPEMTPILQSQISAISQKASLSLFDTNLRILSSAENQNRALEILDQLQSSFEQFNSPILNQIQFRKLKGRKLKKLFYYFSFRIFNEKEAILLSSGELASLFHFPSPTLLTPILNGSKLNRRHRLQIYLRKALFLAKIFFGPKKELFQF